MSTHSPLRASAALTGLKSCADRLLPEVLSTIFLEVLALHEHPVLIISTSPYDIPEEDNFVEKTLHTLSHVCRYWREVAIGNSALWQRIHSRCFEQMEVFLERSLPLTVSLSLDVAHWGAQEKEPIPPPMASVVKMYAVRLHRLDLLVVPASPNIPLLLEPLQIPHLEILTMTSPCKDFPSSSGETINREFLFNSETSQLKALAITPIANWIPSSTSFPRLTHLFVSFGQRGTALWHPWDVLQLLSNAPVLEFLRVESFRCDAPYSGSWPPPSDLVPLLRLRSLVFMSCDRKLIHAVMSRLALPADVFIRLHDVMSEQDSGAYYPTPLPNIVLRPVTSLDICMGELRILAVADGPTSGLWFEGWISYEPGYMGPIGWERWLLNLHECVTLSHVTHLHLSIAGYLIFLPALLDQMPQVSHLAVVLAQEMLFNLTSADVHVPDVVAAYNLSDVLQAPDPPAPLEILCRALSPSTTAPGGGGQPQVRCPALSTLTIEWLASPTALYPRLPEMVAARARAGHLIPRVVIVQAAQSHWGEPPLMPDSDSDSDPAPVTLPSLPPLLDISVFRDSRPPWVVPDGTAYETVPWVEDPAFGLCAFVMRDVWVVRGEDRYWELGGAQKPSYVS